MVTIKAKRMKIDLEKLICSLMSDDSHFINRFYKNLLRKALKEQGIEYKDGKIVELDQPPLTEEQEPKFKIGDWLVNKKQVSEAFCITQINKPYYYSTNLGSFIKFGEEENYRKWTIKDAKPGDILVNDFHLIFILKEIRNNTFISYCSAIERDDDTIINSIAVREVGDARLVKVMPATREQRDKLFKVVEKEGYKWNHERLDLEKIDNPQTIKFNEEEKESLGETFDNDKYYSSFWPWHIIKESDEETIKNTPKVTEGLREYFSNIFPYLFNIDIEKMVEEYRESLNSAFLPLGYSPVFLNDFLSVYRKGLEDMLNKIKKGGKDE